MVRDHYALWNRLAQSALIRAVVNRRLHAITRRRTRELGRIDLAQTQAEVLLGIVRKAALTPFGGDHQFARIGSLAEFRERVPLRTYEDHWRDYWDKAAPDASGITWPGPVRYWAVDEPGRSGEAKRIPVSSEMLETYRAAVKTVIASHWRAHPRSRLFQGRLLVLPGETKPLESGTPSVVQGPPSSLVCLTTGPWIRPLLLPTADSHPDGENRNERLVESSLREPVTLIVGTPEQLTSFLGRVLTQSGKATIAQVWPSLELVVRVVSEPKSHPGGLTSLLGSRAIRIMDSFACAEGLMGYTTPGSDHFRFHFDRGIYYEFIPVQELGSRTPTRHWLGNIKSDTEYAVAISSCSGLWGYLLEQTIRFPSITPPLFSIIGKSRSRRVPTESMLESGEIGAAIADALRATSSVASDWRAGFLSETGRSHYEIVLEFLIPPRDFALFRRALDEELARRNGTYRKLRGEQGPLSAPRVAVAMAGGLDSWSRTRSLPDGPPVDLTHEPMSALIDFLRSRGWLLAASDQDTAARR